MSVTHWPSALQTCHEPQGVPTGNIGWEHPPAPSQRSLVQALLSSEHVASEDWKPSVGQLAPAPVQYSAASHSPAEVRHWVVLEANPSTGQLSLLPVQVSATSQLPAELRHTVVAGCLASSGHAAALPVQYSAASHTPAEARHSVVAGLKLQLVVDWLGLHTWQSPPGLVAPSS